MKNYPDKIFVVILLYLLIYFVRLQQGGWEGDIEVLVSERAFLRQRIEYMLPKPQSDLLSGILLGSRSDLQGELKLALRDTSTLHIVVVSGQNLTLVAGIFWALSGLIGRKKAITAGFLATTAYMLLTGAQLPVIRAYIMTTMVVVSQLYGRQKDTIWGLLVAAGLMLWVNPLWILDLSFQLSFLATFGVTVVASILSNYLRKVPAFLRENIAVTVGAQIMVAPIIASNFHQISLVGLAANLMVIWTVPYIFFSGIASVVVSLFSNQVGQVFFISTDLLLKYFVYAVKLFASFDYAWIYVGDLSILVWVGYYLILGGILLALKNK